MMSRVVGSDLDNTIIDYGDLFYQVAVTEGLLPDSGEPVAKPLVRQLLRAQPDGETKWQLVQSVVYSRELSRAQLFDGVTQFLEQCRQSTVTVYIISHKTESPHSESVPAVNLRQAARSWLEQQGLFEPTSPCYLPREHVFFHATRDEKLASIRHQRCDYYIDDLREVLTDSTFPGSTKPVLFSPRREAGPHGITTCATWQEISKVIFNEM